MPKIRKIGSSYAVTIPKSLMDALRWKPGDQVDLEIIGVGAVKISKE